MKNNLIRAITPLLIMGVAVFSYSAQEHHSSHRNAKPDDAYAWKVQWNTLEEGIIKSAHEGKPMLVDFAVHDGCTRCEFMQKNVYSNDIIVEKINKDFIPVFINLAEPLTSNEQALGEKHEYHEDCLLLFLDHNCKPIFDKDGGKMCFIEEIKPAIFIQYLDYVIGMYKLKRNP